MEIAAPLANDDELLAVHEVLEAFARHDARKAKLRYFVGLTFEEAADVLGGTPRSPPVRAGVMDFLANARGGSDARHLQRFTSLGHARSPVARRSATGSKLRRFVH